MRLVGAELLKLRRRWATYVVLGILVGLMVLVYLLVGALARGSAAAGLVTGFPAAYGVINQFVFGLGSLLAVAYAAAVAGADWSFGVMRVIIARGESRTHYVLAKAIGLGIVLSLGVLLAYAAGMALSALASAMIGTGLGAPFGEQGTRSLAASLVLGTYVLCQRAAIGFAVAMVLRSQLAGVVVGIVLYIAEPILSGILFLLAMGGNLRSGTMPTDVQWHQFLPFSIGDAILEEVATVAPGGLSLPAVPLGVALAAVTAYLGLALAIGMVSLRRAQVSG